MSKLLEVENLNTYYGSIHAVKGITFHVDQGEIVTPLVVFHDLVGDARERAPHRSLVHDVRLGRRCSHWYSHAPFRMKKRVPGPDAAQGIPRKDLRESWLFVCLAGISYRA